MNTQYNLIFSIWLLEARGLMLCQDTHSFQVELSRKPEQLREVKPARFLKISTWHFLVQKDLGSCSVPITYYLQALSVPRHVEWQPLLPWTHIPIDVTRKQLGYHGEESEKIFHGKTQSS